MSLFDAENADVRGWRNRVILLMTVVASLSSPPLPSHRYKPLADPETEGVILILSIKKCLLSFDLGFKFKL